MALVRRSGRNGQISLWYGRAVARSHQEGEGVGQELPAGVSDAAGRRHPEVGPRIGDRETVVRFVVRRRRCDLEDIVVPLWRGLKDEKEFKKLLCRETTSRCGKERKPVKEREDLEFNRQEKTLLDTERMMENMKDQGMPMVMQSREDMMEELYEQMEAEGLSREEADEQMEAWSRSQGGSSAEEESRRGVFCRNAGARLRRGGGGGASKYLTHMMPSGAFSRAG